MNKQRMTSLFWEFFRYALVGGIAFLADSGTLILFRELILTGEPFWNLFISTAAGFVVGLVTNYVLSLVFVFRKSENRSSGNSVMGFVVFTIIGIIGLGITELIMYLGTEVLHIIYIPVKIGAAGITLVWNYIGRKLFVFDRKRGKE